MVRKENGAASDRNSSGFSEEQEHEELFIIPRTSASHKDTKRNCTSPEVHKPWVLNGEYESIFSRTGSKYSCGFDGNGASYLKSIREKIAFTSSQKCKNMIIVFGAAFGKEYEEMAETYPRSTEEKSNLVGTCSFLFVNRAGNITLSNDGFRYIISIDPSQMPYDSARRNVKVLKFSPGFIFPWADRIIWQDAKLVQEQFSPMPSNYILHFNRTVQYFGACVSYMGLPLHKFSIGDSPNVSLSSHCDTIIAASKSRPTVSDNIDTIHDQCKTYIDEIGSDYTKQNQMVDTAFIVYDMRSPACQKFNGDFGCSWLDEIHCFSDRDQISFPSVLDSSSLVPASKIDVAGHEYRDKVFITENFNAKIHIAKRSCHWYYQSFPRCVTPINENNLLSFGEEIMPKLPPLAPEELRVAIIIAGTLNRFMFTSTLEQLIRPMTQNGVIVDYYASLTTASVKPYRSDNRYTNHMQMDPDLPESFLADKANIEEYIRVKVANEEASIGALIFSDRINIDSDPMLQEKRALALKKFPNEDPDTRFPIFDIRTTDIMKHTANANQNLLRMHYAIQKLWSIAVSREVEESFEYDYVLFLRDDSLWLNKFDIHHVISKGGDIFVPSCDRRDPPMSIAEVNDHLLISNRKAADIFGNYYNVLHETNRTKCMEKLPKKLRNGEKRGCNSEMLLKHVIDESGLIVTKVGQNDVPFQRSANVKLSDGSIVQCFHKYCQSKDSPLEHNEKLKKCKDLDF